MSHSPHYPCTHLAVFTDCRVYRLRITVIHSNSNLTSMLGRYDKLLTLISLCEQQGSKGLAYVRGGLDL